MTRPARMAVDPFTGEQVVIAPIRGERPAAWSADGGAADDPAACPFCAGLEIRTLPELHAEREGGPANAPGWTVRVVPNLYPAVAWDTAAPGAHEVVVEAPEHLPTWTGLGAGHAEAVFRAYQARLRALRDDPRCQARLLFHNGGRAAGASLLHVHSQIIALPVAPPRAWRRSLAQALTAEAAAERTVFRADGLVAWCPSASRFAWESWLTPEHAAGDFADLSSTELAVAARSFRRLLLATEALAPALNYLLDPLVGDRWLLRVAPRVAGLAGLELGWGQFVNPIPPEQAAADLRARLDTD